MAIPLIPFLVGAAAGAVATYVYKDKESQQSIKKGLDKAGDTLASGAKTVKKTVSDGAKTVKEAVSRKVATEE